MAMTVIRKNLIASWTEPRPADAVLPARDTQETDSQCD
jgi:hypothetical protein